jgi:hypothetical protein
VAKVKYHFVATEKFWDNFYRLKNSQKASVRNVWDTFKKDPFHPTLGAHKIQKLSSLVGKTVYSVVIEADLRALFYVEKNTIITFNIGSHDVYKT